jgi:hypothetical protein
MCWIGLCCKCMQFLISLLWGVGMCVACGALADACVLRIVTTIFIRRKINRLRGGDVYGETVLMCKWRRNLIYHLYRR